MKLKQWSTLNKNVLQLTCINLDILTKPGKCIEDGDKDLKAPCVNIANDSPIEATARKIVIAEFILIWPYFLHIPQICKEQGIFQLISKEMPFSSSWSNI